MLALRSLRIALVATVLAVAALAQVALAPAATPAPPSLMQQFDVSVASLEVLQFQPSAPGHVEVDVALGRRLARLDLYLHEVRTPGFQLLERGPNGLVAVPLPPCVTYRGVLLGDAGSAVAATVDAGSITAYVRTGADELWIVQPVRQVVPGAGPSLHVVYRGADSAVVQGRCGVVAPGLPVPPVAGLDAVYACDLAIEADYPFYQLNGSNTTNTQNDVTGIVNAMDVIYQRDVQVALNLSQLIVDTTTDPYTTSTPGTLLNQFQSYWNANHGSVTRDVAHMFTGRNMGAASGGTIGIAYVGVVCSIPSAYGVSQSRFSNNYSYRVGVTAHEIGHNFGAGHCDASSPCNIMCSGIGGCSNNQSSFSAVEQNQIVAYRQSVGCLPLQATTPAITSASTLSVVTINPPQVTLMGSGFTGTSRIDVGPASVFGGGIQVISDTQVRFNPPPGLSLGFHYVTATNAAGTSNGWPLLYADTNQCQVLVPSIVLGGQTLTWTMGGRANHIGVLLLSLSNTTTPWLGFQVIAGAGILWQGGLDARGMAAYSFPIPPAVLNGVRGYFQMVDIDLALTVQSVSAIPSTLVLF